MTRSFVRQNYLSILCLFLILATGTAYAVDKIGSKDIKRGAVKTKHVANGSLLANDFAAGQLPSGPQGPPGAGGGGPTSGDIAVDVTGPTSASSPASFSHTVTVTNSGPLSLRPTINIRPTFDVDTIEGFGTIGTLNDPRCRGGDHGGLDCTPETMIPAGGSISFQVAYESFTCADFSPREARTRARVIPIELDPSGANDADEHVTSTTSTAPC